jgi:phosphoglycolate phosphatase-like HAD superfamily hydrolase
MMRASDRLVFLMQFKAVLFDLDGTLLDTLGDLANSMNGVLKRRGFPQHERELYKQFVGDGMEVLVRRASGCARRASAQAGHPLQQA